MAAANDAARSLVIQRAASEHIALLQELYVEAARWRAGRGITLWDEHAFTAAYIERFMREKEVFIALADGDGIGCFAIQWSDPEIWRELEHEAAGYLHRLVVSRKYGGMRLGYRLLEWAEEYVKSQGKRFFRLDCMAENKGLNQYYAEAGFAFVRTAAGEGWSANLYEKKLR
ncbi:GNAT family N-acetyltransferase [Paenibacillus dendritiformis]|uniref:GNAT family N-acetyltransferase n=1 Tax=Paenibacillus dendritiformis TaxID=130049 RepID=UPI00143D7443|nr:GNAT family N-acetyltransferase [Paenibacillus dendritiformis]NKI19959.1 GNAT family N-acetyltransferase [Paenibacillus dendritiformis]NRG00290.1 GNAT family N-acetyltransferase [Paenibacillus dendritiformis]